jgi:hypothetical protein
MRSTRDQLHRKIDRLEAEVKRLRALLENLYLPDYFRLSDFLLRDRVAQRNQRILVAIAEIDERRRVG